MLHLQGVTLNRSYLTYKEFHSVGILKWIDYDCLQCYNYLCNFLNIIVTIYAFYLARFR